MGKTIKWNDLQSGEIQEVKRAYKMTDRELERQVRDHLYGAQGKELNKGYEMVYRKRK